jgi:uncharacterized phage protein (TIGR01671 family)
MREIKFRCWGEESKKWFYYDEIQGRAHIQPDQKCSKSCQFTGLKDRKGKEIYEGDIIKYCDYDTDINHRNKSGYDDEDNGVGIVRFGHNAHTPPSVSYSHGWWIDVRLPKENSCESRGMEMTSMEVIGNILENPELVK